GLQSVDHTHQITANAAYELPLGSQHFLLGNAPAWVQNVVSKWQLGGIFNFLTGPPLTLTTGVNTITNNAANPSVAGKVPSGFGKLTKTAAGINYLMVTHKSMTPALRLYHPCARLQTAPAIHCVLGIQTRRLSIRMEISSWQTLNPERPAVSGTQRFADLRPCCLT